jgi:hypothetical protein
LAYQGKTSVEWTDLGTRSNNEDQLKLKCFQAWDQLEFWEPSLTNTCIYEFFIALTPTTEHGHRNKLYPLQTVGTMKKHLKISHSKAWYCR